MASDAGARVGDRTRRFESLGVPEFRRLWWGGVFVFLAMQTQQIARSWLAFELTGTNTALGGVLVGFGVAGLIAIPTGGVLADRFNKRTILVSTQLINTMVAIAIAAAVETGVIAYWMIVVASVIGGSTISILAPARIAMTADIVDRKILTNAIMLGTMSAQATRVVGPAVAGVMIGVATIGVEGVYYLSAVLSLVAVILSMRLPLGAPAPRAASTPIADLRDGLQYTRDRPELVRLLTLSVIVVMFGFAHIAFLPSLIADVYNRGAASLGSLTAAAAIGAVITAVTLANTARDRLTLFQGRSAYAVGFFLLVFSVVPNFYASLAVMFMLGGAMAAFQSLNGSLVLSSADMEYHGRVQSLVMLSYSAFGLAALPFGIIADAVGLRPTMFAMALAVLVGAGHSQFWRRRLTRLSLNIL